MAHYTSSGVFVPLPATPVVTHSPSLTQPLSCQVQSSAASRSNQPNPLYWWRQPATSTVNSQSIPTTAVTAATTNFRLPAPPRELLEPFIIDSEAELAAE